MKETIEKREVTGADLYILLACAFLLVVAAFASDWMRGFHRI